jgi:hypothetical protein
MNVKRSVLKIVGDRLGDNRKGKIENEKCWEHVITIKVTEIN